MTTPSGAPTGPLAPGTDADELRAEPLELRQDRLIQAELV